MNFVAGKLYKPAEPYDKEQPQYDCLMPAETGNYYAADCFICDQQGNICPGYSNAPMPILAIDLGEPVS